MPVQALKDGKRCYDNSRRRQEDRRIAQPLRHHSEDERRQTTPQEDRGAKGTEGLRPLLRPREVDDLGTQGWE